MFLFHYLPLGYRLRGMAQRVQEKKYFYPLLAFQSLCFLYMAWLHIVLTWWVIEYRLYSWRAATPALFRDPASAGWAISCPHGQRASEVTQAVVAAITPAFCIWPGIPWGIQSLSCGAFVGLPLTNAYLFFLKAHRVSEAKTEPSFAFLGPTGMASGILQLQHEWGHLMA